MYTYTFNNSILFLYNNKNIFLLNLNNYFLNFIRFEIVMNLNNISKKVEWKCIWQSLFIFSLFIYQFGYIFFLRDLDLLNTDIMMSSDINLNVFYKISICIHKIKFINFFYYFYNFVLLKMINTAYKIKFIFKENSNFIIKIDILDLREFFLIKKSNEIYNWNTSLSFFIVFNKYNRFYFYNFLSLFKGILI